MSHRLVVPKPSLTGGRCEHRLVVDVCLPVKDALQGLPVQHIFCTQHEHLQATANKHNSSSIM